MLAHADATHVRRLLAALDPFDVFLHIDARTPDDVHREMTRDLPERVRLLSRRRTGWATWGVVAAELDGYRAVIGETDATHVALLSGSDYPIVPSTRILQVLDEEPLRSYLWYRRLPDRRQVQRVRRRRGVGGRRGDRRQGAE